MAKKQHLSWQMVALIAAALVLGGCDYFKKKEDPPKPSEAAPSAAAAPNGEEATPEKSTARVPRGRSATGTIDGIPIQIAGGEISEGILTLWQEKDRFSENKVMVFLFNEEKGTVPEGKKYSVALKAEGMHPHIHYSAKGNGKEASGAVMEDYRMELEFGRENPRGTLPGKIDLEVPDKNLKLTGTFAVKIKGFRLIDGKPDLTSDSFETLKAVSQAHLEKENAGKAIQVVNARDGMFTHANEKQPEVKPWGRYSISYTVDGAQTNWVKHLYVKNPEGWAVTGSLLPHQVFDAHPAVVPTPAGWLNEYLRYVAAKKLDEELTAAHAGEDVSGVDLRVNVDASKQSGTCDVTYTLNSAEVPVKKAYVLRLDGTNWVAESQLAPAPTPVEPPPVPTPAPSAETPPAQPAPADTNAPPAQPLVEPAS